MNAPKRIKEEIIPETTIEIAIILSMLTHSISDTIDHDIQEET